MKGFFPLLPLLGIFFLFTIAASSREEEVSNLKPVRLADENALRETEVVETRSARASEGRSPRTKKRNRDGTLKKKTSINGPGRRRQDLLRKRITKKKDTKKDESKEKNGPKKKNKPKKERNPKEEEKKKRNGKKRRRTKRRRMGSRKLDKNGKPDNCPSTRTDRAINETCLVNIITIVKTYYTQVKNFEKQWKRIVSKNKTSVSKGGKTDVFKKPLERLVEAGGGDGSNMSCQVVNDQLFQNKE